MIKNQSNRNLNKIKEKIEEMNKNVNPKSTSINEAPLTENLDFFRQMKTMEIEAQHSVNEW